MRFLRNKTALVTGGSYGVGVHIAEALIKEGVKVALVARSSDKLNQVVDRLRAKGGQAVPITADLSNSAERTRVIKQAEAELGQIDILINNAGIVGLGPFARQEQTEILRILETNLIAPLVLTRELLPQMIKRGQGHVVNISSLSGKKGVLYEATYAATKAALIEWTSAVRMELEATAVGFSVICPIFISDSGELARYGLKPSLLLGHVQSHDVAKAVIIAIKRNLQEVIVRPGPTRPLLAVNALSPSFGNSIVKLMGIRQIQTELAKMEAKTKNQEWNPL